MLVSKFAEVPQSDKTSADRNRVKYTSLLHIYRLICQEENQGVHTHVVLYVYYDINTYRPRDFGDTWMRGLGI